MNGLRRKSADLAFALLDATTRTWQAFWGTIAIVLFYCWWNESPNTHEHFDPYPYTFLMVLIAAFSYLQNIIIMTLQRKQDAQFAEIKAKQEEQDQYIMHLMETAVAQNKLLIAQAEKDAERDERMLELFHALPCRSEVSP